MDLHDLRYSEYVNKFYSFLGETNLRSSGGSRVIDLSLQHQSERSLLFKRPSSKIGSICCSNWSDLWLGMYSRTGRHPGS